LGGGLACGFASTRGGAGLGGAGSLEAVWLWVAGRDPAGSPARAAATEAPLDRARAFDGAACALAGAGVGEPVGFASSDAGGGTGSAGVAPGAFAASGCAARGTPAGAAA